MKKNVIALLLAFVMVSGSIGPVPGMATEITIQEAMDVQVFQYAMKEYMGSTHKNLNHLMTYAKKLHIDSAVRTYTEVML